MALFLKKEITSVDRALYVHIHPFRFHVFDLVTYSTGEKRVVLMSDPAMWPTATSNQHGEHSYSPGVSSFCAHYNYMGNKANFLWHVQFRQSQWLTKMFGDRAFFGYVGTKLWCMIGFVMRFTSEEEYCEFHNWTWGVPLVEREARASTDDPDSDFMLLERDVVATSWITLMHE